ncbi:restriction endonuclease subunit S [Candidatus Poribacteria bacterium]|nr:restriction endonuclease subunit S [Candidatus Poribacteria bacterium]
MINYPAFNESSVDWIGEIPKHWKTIRLKHVAGILPSNVDKHIYPDEIQVRLCNYTDVYYNDFITVDTVLTKGSCTEKEFSKFALKIGDVIITKDSETPYDIGIPTFVKEDLDNVVCGYHLTMIRSNECLGEFIFWFIKSDWTRRYFQLNSNGITRFGLGKSSIENLLIPIPSESEQTQIANFLDRKTEQIDQLIRIKEQKIELLQEQRTALINHAVTKGLDPNVEMKPSGVEWIGDIPKHWDLCLLKYTARLIYGDSLITENREDGVVPVYGSNGIIDTHSSANTLSPAIIVGRKGSLGKVQYSDSSCFVIDTAFYIDRNTTNVNLRWLYYVLNTLKLERFQNSIVPGLNRENAESQHVPQITIAQQTQIADFLDQKTKQIDDLINAENKKIELLKEYRQSLISEAVTGKIDVCNEA